MVLLRIQSMKKYAIILLLLIGVGIALSISLFTQEQRLDQTVFQQTTESIRNLQSSDKNLSLLLSRSRYNIGFDHEQLYDVNYEISDEFDNLRFDALFEESEASPRLSEAINRFYDQVITREEGLETYVASNESLLANLERIKELSAVLLDASQSNEISATLFTVDRNTAQLLNLALSDKAQASANAQGLSLELLNTSQVDASVGLSESVEQYNLAVARVNDLFSSNTQDFQALSDLQTGSLLDAIENEYTAYHNQGIQNAQRNRNLLFAYGAALLLALLFFAWRIRQNYLNLEQEVAARTVEIQSAYQALQESQEQLIQSEKMASLGQMVAGVAHEINTPLGYVSSNVETLQDNLNDVSAVFNELDGLNESVRAQSRDKKEIGQRIVSLLKAYKEFDTVELMNESQQLLSDGAYGLSEISQLVSGLKDFSRLDRQANENVSLNDCLKSTLTIASNQIKENNVRVETDLNDIPNIDCVPSKLNQLFLNIITNACQAMQKIGGVLAISTEADQQQIKVRFADQGEGMSQATQQKMFDPFFTTKEIGQGTGLGMSIAYKIIEAHKGSIDVESAPNVGTTITVSLPIAA